jgi:hypothetical protein
MQDGAGVGRKKSDARTPSIQRGRSAPATQPVLNDSEQDPANIHHCFLGFLPGSDLQVEFAVTHSKQTAAPFLPGSRIAHFAYRTLSRDAHCHARSFIGNALSNRELRLLEPRLSHRKQTIAPRSNRELSTNRCRVNSHAVIPVPTFLTETASHSEMAVTHSKQRTATFLTGARIDTKRLVSRTVFHPVSSELFSTHRRISLQDGIAQPWSFAGTRRMLALVGRA